MSVEAMSLVLHHSRAKGTDKLVLIGIANHAGDGGAWPSIETLARYANITERGVQKCLTKLIHSGELLVYRNDGGTRSHRGNRRPNRYEVIIACPLSCDRSMNHRPRRYPVPADNLTFTTSAAVDNSDLGVNAGSPQSARGELQDVSRGELQDTLTSPSNHPSSAVAYLGPDRARDTCDICSRSWAACVLVNQREDDHEFVSSLAKAKATGS